MKQAIVLLLLILWLNPGFSQETTQVDSDRFHELISSANGVLLDVRTSREFKNGHIPEAGNLNYYALDFRKKLILLPRDKPIYLYCNTGYRSDKAGSILTKNGYNSVFNLEHGIMEWELKELPVIIEPDASPDFDHKMDPAQYYALLETDSLVLFDFYAPWCGPCRSMMPLIDSLKVEYFGKVKICKVNVDASKKLVRELQLIGVPYLALFHKNQVRFSRNGIASRQELTDILNKNISELTISETITTKTDIFFDLSVRNWFSSDYSYVNRNPDTK